MRVITPSTWIIRKLWWILGCGVGEKLRVNSLKSRTFAWSNAILAREYQKKGVGKTSMMTPPSPTE